MAAAASFTTAGEGQTAEAEGEKKVPSFTPRECKFMKLALEQAQLAFKTGEVAVGCILVDIETDEVVGRGGNQTNVSQDGTRHCEFIAMEDAVRRKGVGILRRCELFVTVEPCIMCAFALREAGVARVVYGCGNDRFGGNGSVVSVHDSSCVTSPSHAYPSRGGLFADEAVEALRQFYQRGNIRAPKPQRAVPAAAAAVASP